MGFSDGYGLTGSVQPVAPEWGPDGFNPFNPGGVVAHHIAAGIVGIIAGLFHLTVRPPQRLYKALRMGNIETVLSSSIAAVFFAAFVWQVRCGTVAQPHRLNYLDPPVISGTVAYFKTRDRAARSDRFSAGTNCWKPGRLFQRSWPFTTTSVTTSKGGLFRGGPMYKGDGVAVGWLGHPTFNDKKAES